MNYLALDWGKSKIGVAIGSDDTHTAVPLTTLKNPLMNELINQIHDLVLSENIDQVIVGKPVSLSGNDQMSDVFEKFLSSLRFLGTTVILEDERMSTASAQKLNRGMGMGGADDAVAAMVILQTFLDRKRNE